ncbi:MAG: gliding motility-associated protein GldE [Paludibacteraceae bacterium]|nr:gliding motility-associated protein GldE [Paludibacteraceae bacterium]
MEQLYVNSTYVSLFFSILCCLVLLLCSAFVSASEVAFFSLLPKDIEELTASSDRKDTCILELKSNSERLLATILLANNLVNIAIIVLSTSILFSLFDFSDSIWLGFLVETVFITLILLLFGENMPKIYAAKYPLRFARFAAPTMRVLIKLLHPFSWLLVKSTSNVKLFDKKKSIKTLSTSDLSKAYELTSSELEEDKEILEGIIRFSNTEVESIIVPRVDVVAVDITDSFTDIIRIINESGYSRLPVYAETIDNIKGILFIKDMLAHINKGDEFKWQKHIRPAFFVPTTKHINVLLEDFQKNKTHIAVVVDEFGGTVGIVTLEDILEEIVGDISDEYDDENERSYIQLDTNTFVFEAKILLEDFYKIEGIEKKDFEKIAGEPESLAGLILEIKGEIPQVGDVVLYDNYEFEIVSADKRRIKTIKLTIHEPIQEDEL